MIRLHLLVLAAPVALAACHGDAAPGAVGDRVGYSLNCASVATGNAIGVAGDQTGAALQRAGNSVQRATSP